MEFIGLHIFGGIVLVLFGFGVGRKWESLNSPKDVIDFYTQAQDKVKTEISTLEGTVNGAQAKLEKLKSLVH